jgi:hypothetical protein
MVIDYQKFKPINIFGYIVSTFGIAGLIVAHGILAANENFPSKWFVVIGALQIFLFLFGGIGIILKRIWGYYFIKIILYLLFPAFPIGTLVSIQMLRYIRNNNIKDFFTCRSIEF